MKTALLGKYIDRLAALNDQLCFFQFNRNELNKRLIDFGPNARSLYTPDVFAQNPMASRINVTLDDLPTFQTLNQTFTFGAYISTSYEVVSHYIQDSLELLNVINPSTFQLIQDRQLEEKYFLTLASSGCTAVPREVIDTIKYIRQRRNHFTHLNDSLSNEISNLITNSGTALNAYWSTAVSDLDFTSMDILTFEEDETIDILKLLRIIVQTLDSNLASNFSDTGVATFLANREFAPKPQRLNKDIVGQRIKKIKNLSNTEFGINLSDNVIDPIVRTIGRR